MSDMKEKKETGWPDSEPPPSAEEEAQAAQLSRDLERLIAGEKPRDPDEELAAAIMFRAAEGREPGLDPGVRRDLTAAAIAQAEHGKKLSKVRLAAPLVAMAAALLLVASGLLLAPAMMSREAPARAAAPETLSRSSDDMMGKPFTNRAGASSRLDRVFADRLRGYRHVVLAMGDTR